MASCIELSTSEFEQLLRFNKCKSPNPLEPKENDDDDDKDEEELDEEDDADKDIIGVEEYLWITPEKDLLLLPFVFTLALTQQHSYEHPDLLNKDFSFCVIVDCLICLSFLHQDFFKLLPMKPDEEEAIDEQCSSVWSKVWSICRRGGRWRGRSFPL